MQLDHFAMYPERAFMKVAGRMTLEGGGKGGSAPPPPDYAAAAQQTAAGNLATARIGQYGNMVNQYTPYGSVTYTPRTTGYINTEGKTLTPEEYNARKQSRTVTETNPETGETYTRTVGGEDMSGWNPLEQWSQQVTLSPEQQAAYNKDVQMNAALQNVGIQGVGYVQSALDKPLSFQGMQELQTPGQIQQQASDAAYQNAMRYVEPQLQRQQASLETQLANQGITRGSEAWNAAMADQNAKTQDIYAQARNAAYTQGLTGAGQAYQQGLGLRQQQIAEAQTLRADPLNMLNAVRTGSQMQTSAMPQVGASSPGQLATVSGPDLLSAATAQGQYNMGQYNANQAAQNNLTSGLFGLGGAGIMSYGMMAA